MIIASAFLSHSSSDKPLVEAVARELGRRGILAWLDKNDLQAGMSLSAGLREAVRKQITLILFLSQASVASPWVNDEVAAALELDKETENKDKIIPVYLGDPLQLVSSHPLLKTRWLHHDGDRVDKLGIYGDPRKDRELLAKEIAEKAAERVYKILRIEKQQDVIIYIDQRGTGRRSGIPAAIPPNLAALDAPALLFRPDLNERTPGETLSGQMWNDIRITMKWALSRALDGVRWHTPKNIRLLGASQLGVPFLIGHYFNRNTSANLFCTNTVDSTVFNNSQQERTCPLTGGNAHCESSHPAINPIQSTTKLDSIALLLLSMVYVEAVNQYLAVQDNPPPLVWVKNDKFTNNQQVLQYIADIVALLTRFKSENGIRTVQLFCGLPFNVVSLLAANLLHVIENVVFMEYRRDLQGSNAGPGEIYVPIQIN